MTGTSIDESEDFKEEDTSFVQKVYDRVPSPYRKRYHYDRFYSFGHEEFKETEKKKITFEQLRKFYWRTRKWSDASIVLVGDSTSGKTAFIERYIKNTFRGLYEPTVLDVYRTCFTSSNLTSKKIEIHDTSSSDSYTLSNFR